MTPAQLNATLEVVDAGRNPVGVTIASFTPLQARATGVAGVDATLDGFIDLNAGDVITQEGEVTWWIRQTGGGSGLIEDEFTAPMLADERNRVSDVAMGVIQPVAAWNDIQRQQGADQIYGDNFIGLISAGEFDGSGQLLGDRDITIQTRIEGAANEGLPVTLDYDFDVPDAYLTPEGAPETPNRYWLPQQSSIIDDPETPETEVLEANSEARTISPSLIDAAFREFIVPSSDPEMGTSSDLELILTINSIPAARYTDITDPRTVIPWSIDIQRFVAQRGGVTILNNVIYPAAGDETVLIYDLERASIVSVVVFTLDGQLVQTLQRGRLAAGEHRVSWDGTNMDGQTVAPGLYFIRVVASGIDEIRKVLIAR